MWTWTKAAWLRSTISTAFGLLKLFSGTKTRLRTRVDLTDSFGVKIREWYVVFHAREGHWIFKWLKPGFQHIELTRPEYFGPGPTDCVWLNVLPTFELLEADISTDPRPPWLKCPTSTVQKVTTLQPFKKLRSRWDMGPPTCVEVAKMVLGIRAFWVRTPWQLHEYISKRGCVIDGRRRGR